jgi:carbamoyltransferase
MVILGVSNTTDSGAALIVDGKVLAAINEERIVRKKQIRAFPAESIKWVLGSQGLKLSDVDWVGSGCWKGIDQAETLPILVRDILSQVQAGGDLGEVQNRVCVTTSRDLVFHKELHDNLIALGFRNEQICWYDHHYSHAATAFYPSPFENAFVFTADGRGDCRSVTLWEASRDKGLHLVDSASEMASPGVLYGYITKYLGFIPDRHEGKVTGLAAHGRKGPAYDLLHSVYHYDEAEKRIKTKIGDYYRPFASAVPPRLPEALQGIPREDVAFAVQKLLEDVLCSFLMRHIAGKPQGSVNLCLAGGCMSNVKLNYELSALPPVRDVYVFPQMGDGGAAMGGAMAVAAEKYGAQRFDIPTVYLGPGYDDAEIERVFKAEGVSYRKLNDAERTREVVELLAANKVVGWYQGRMEYGPRALGNRTILASATDASVNDVLNKRLQRTEFMPFAPVTIDKHAPRCFEGWQPDQVSSRFMTICYRATPLLAERCPGIVHIDGTARPQVVFREHNPRYYDVIEAYVAKTGNPALVNTSFNHHEEPIINTPNDAVRSLRKGNVDVLMAGNLIVKAS